MARRQLCRQKAHPSMGGNVENLHAWCSLYNLQPPPLVESTLPSNRYCLYDLGERGLVNAITFRCFQSLVSFIHFLGFVCFLYFLILKSLPLPARECIDSVEMPTQHQKANSQGILTQTRRSVFSSFIFFNSS